MNSLAKTKITNFVKFSDLLDQKTVVIHIGNEASRDGIIRSALQRDHNGMIVRDYPIDPEIEPEQTLYISDSQLEEGNKLYRMRMADRDATHRVIVHIKGMLVFEKIMRLVQELMRQAPNAELYLGRQGHNAQPWNAMVSHVKMVAELEAESRPSRFTLISGYVGFDKQASYLIKGVLPAESTCAINGPSANYKTFLSMSLCCHVATGKEWDGRHVTKGPVLYIVGEGGVGVPRRIRAWAEQYNNGADIPNFYRIDMPVFMADPAQINDLKIAADKILAETGEPVRMIVVDTVARCFGGGDENRAADMGAFIAGCDTIKAMTGATILLIHHTGKNEENGARGSSAFKAALDAEYLVKRENGDAPALTLTCTKMKDAEEPAKRSFDLRSCAIFLDDDGDEITSLVLVDQGREPNDPEASGLSPLSKALFQAIRKAAGINGLADKDKVRGEFKDTLVNGKKPNISNFSRHLKTLAADGLISISGDEVKIRTLDDLNDDS